MESARFARTPFISSLCLILLRSLSPCALRALLSLTTNMCRHCTCELPSTVPALCLSDGSTVLTESMAIVKYLDAYNTDGAGTSLVGMTAEERAETDMWCGRVDEKFLFPFGVAFRCGPMAEWFKDRRPDFILPDAAPPMVEMAQAGLAWLDSGAVLGDGRPFLCGDRFTVADMRLFTYYRFVAKIHKAQRAPVALSHFHAYIERVAGRDSVAAIAPKKK